MKRCAQALGEEGLDRALDEADALAFVDWTMVPGFTGILRGIHDCILPRISPKDRLFFFDLADPRSTIPTSCAPRSKSFAIEIQQRLAIEAVVVHTRDCAACAEANGTPCEIEVPACVKPRVFTGAGDHFNAGYLFRRNAGLLPRKGSVPVPSLPRLTLPMAPRLMPTASN